MSKIRSLELFAGPKARQHLFHNGLKAADICTMLAASGGPKWMALFGLDQYLTREFLSPEQPLKILGSSAGAMRACCYAQKNSGDAIQRFADAYTNTRYDKKPSPADITASAHVLLEQLFGSSGQHEAINNPNRHINIVTARCKGLSAAENSWLQGMGMLGGYALNKCSRKLLDLTFERVIFFTGEPLIFEEHFPLKTRYININQQNLYLAALASGSIPMVMEGIQDIPGAPRGCYRDGGIIDYHFDLNTNNGLCLYPHFNHSPRPAWFDKFGSRKIRPEHYENTLILAPSAEFVASLPFNKIPDRNDFANITDQEREKFWRRCQSESQRLAEEFDHLLKTQDWQSVKPIEKLD